MLTSLLLLTFIPAELKAATKTEPITTRTVESEEANSILKRLNEIDAMDKSNLSRSEKKDLRKEVKESKKKMKELGGGVYLSVGAVIIIILLLIILL